MPQRSADAAFDRVAQEIFESLIELSPIEATSLGIHGPNDARLPIRTQENHERELSVLQNHLKDLTSFREKDLSIERVVDLRLARGGINGRLLRMQKRSVWKRCPRCYVDDIVFGLYSLLIRDFAPAPQRARSLLGRLKEVPAHLENSRRNLEDPSPIFAEGAVLSAGGAVVFFDTTIKEFVSTVEDPKLRTSLMKALDRGRTALLDYTEWLEGNLMPRSTGEFAIGRTLFERLLVEEQALNLTTEELIAEGQTIYQETLREMKRVAARITPGKPWSKVVENLKLVHPQEGEILATYRSEMIRARAFVQKKNLVGFPEGESIEVVPTPEFARPMIPFAAYLGPAPFEADQKGIFWVTTIDPTVDEPHRQSLLRGHARHGIAVTALHEAYPGHHLQVTHANKLRDRKLRFLFPSSTFVEGWALYCEEMMYRNGFCKNDEARLLQLKDLLWRSCGVILDVELQTGRMGFNEAVGFLVRKAHIERQNAVAEVRRYCAQPTQPMSNVAGKVQIEELLEDYKAKQGDRFDLRAFHDELLSHGAIPVELIRLGMGIPHRRPSGPGHRRSLSSQTRAAGPLATVGDRVV